MIIESTYNDPGKKEEKYVHPYMVTGDSENPMIDDVYRLPCLTIVLS